MNIDDDESSSLPPCSSVLPVICEHHRTIDDCGSEGCAKYGHRWNTWNGEDGCEEMGELGYSPYDEEKKETPNIVKKFVNDPLAFAFKTDEEEEDE